MSTPVHSRTCPRRPRGSDCSVWPALLYSFALLLPMVGLQTESLAAEVSIAVIDPNRIVEESPQYEQARGMLSTEVKEREAELLDQQSDIDRLSEKFERDGALMSEDEIKRLQNDIRARKRRLRYAQEELQEDLSLRQRELRTKLVQQVEEVVRQIAKEKKIDVILSEGLVYFSQRVDISSDVIDRLREEFQSQ